MRLHLNNGAAMAESRRRVATGLLGGRPSGAAEIWLADELGAG